ncbi:DUF1302 family protein [Thalassolituus alkanivorans]|uniref:DUF1302 family protein n=1 Tax=Thalassolituus alkanivorans TaxID=2881055 RepID=UPI001E470777|nr:DUF1302 family protein [Thalassolituus alkanivorans]MCB2385961.1 hypothetical protein [Thalassolituus alkanivorans]MCB2422588.1 hypothetical protein [Thalassolituus alkanivorans]
MIRIALVFTLLLATGVALAAPSFSGKGHAEIRQQERAGKNSGEDPGQRYEGLLEGQMNTGRLKTNAILLGRYRSQYDDAEGEVRDEMRSDAELRELYLTWSADRFEIRAGKQQQAWGRADYFRIVDVWNPLDLREFLLPYFDNYSLGRQPRGMLITDYFGDTWEQQLIIAVQRKTTRLAPAGSDFAANGMPATLPAVNEEGSGVDIGWRGKIFWGGNDIELYAFHGYHADEMLTFENAQLVREQPERDMVGTSLARPMGDWVLRSDIAHYLREGRQTAAGIEDSSRTLALLGFDRVENEWTWNLQLATTHWYDEESNHDDVWESSVSVEKNWSRYRLTTGLLWLVNWVDDSSQLWRATVNYEFLPQWKVGFAAVAFDGKDDTQFGQFDNQDRLMLTLRRDFAL